MKVYDVIMVGSGPAGLTAAIYAGRAKLETLILEQSGMSGGQILNTYEVDNYPGLPGISGYDLGKHMRAHVDQFHITVLTATMKAFVARGDIKEVITEQETYYAKTVIMAMGATYARLGVQGEEMLLGKGVSYCATCDGAFFRDKVVAVVGGGNVAVEDAIYLSRFAKKVYVIHRRDQLRAAPILQEKLLEIPVIEVLWNTQVIELVGEEVLEQIRVKTKTGDVSTIAVQGVFIAIGIIPNTQAIDKTVEKDAKGYLMADETCATNVEGVYACGDVRTKQLRQVVTAVADGANAITSIEHYLINR